MNHSKKHASREVFFLKLTNPNKPGLFEVSFFLDEPIWPSLFMFKEELIQIQHKLLRLLSNLTEIS